MAADERMQVRMRLELRAIARVWMDEGATAVQVSEALTDTAGDILAEAVKCLQPGPGLTKARPR